MKIKKTFVAGALALAMGLSFVAPSFADEASIDVDKLVDGLNGNTQGFEDVLVKVQSNKPSTTDSSTQPSPQPSSPQPSSPQPSTEKPSTTKPEDKKPSTNAKTGIVGVAGVAAVLAAASGAYVSSKRK